MLIYIHLRKEYDYEMSTYTYYFLDGIDKYMYNINGEQVIDMDDIPITSTICNIPEEYYLREGKTYKGILAELDAETWSIAKGRVSKKYRIVPISIEDIETEEEASGEDKYEWEDDLSDELNEFLSSLTEYQRTILQMKADGLGVTKIAKEFGVTRNAIINILDKINKKAMKGKIYGYFVGTHNLYK